MYFKKMQRSLAKKDPPQGVRAFFKQGLEELERKTDSLDDFPTIDQIEATWGNLNSETSRLYAEITEKAISHINERRLIESKKESTHREE